MLALTTLARILWLLFIILHFCSQNDCQRQKAYSCTLYIFVQFYLSALPWLANIYLSEMDCNLLVPLCVSERQMQTEKQEQYITSLKCYSSVSGHKDRGLLSIAGECMYVRVCWCATRTLQGWTYKPCWDLQSEVALLQAIKQAIIIYFLAFLAWLENVKVCLYFSLPFWKMCCLHILLLCA